MSSFNTQPYPLWCGVAIDWRETPDEELKLKARVGRVIGWAVDNSQAEEGKAVVPLVAFDDPETGATEPAARVCGPLAVAMFVRDTQEKALAAAKSYVEHGKAKRPSRKVTVVR